MNNPILASLLTVYASQNGMGEPVFQESGSVILEIESGAPIHIETDMDATTLFISSPIGRTPGGPERLAYLESLFRAQAFGIATADCYFFVHPEQMQTFLFKRINVATATPESVADAIDQFLQNLAIWRKASEEGRIIENEIPITPPSTIHNTMPGLFA